jgi:hypothetical protein
MWAAETVQGWVLRSQNGLTVRSSGPGSRLGGRLGWAAGHPYAAAGGGMMGFAVSTGRRGPEVLIPYGGSAVKSAELTS